MIPPTISNLLNEKDVSPRPTKFRKLCITKEGLDSGGMPPELVQRLPSFADLISPMERDDDFSAPDTTVALPQGSPLSRFPRKEPSRPVEDLLALSFPRPAIYPYLQGFSKLTTLEPSVTTVSAASKTSATGNRIPGCGNSPLSRSRLTFILGSIRPSDMVVSANNVPYSGTKRTHQEMEAVPLNIADNSEANKITNNMRVSELKRTRSEMEAATALPELAIRAPLISPVTEDGSPEDRVHPFAPSDSEARPSKVRVISTAAQPILSEATGPKQVDAVDKSPPVANPPAAAGNKKKKKKVDKRKRRRGPKNLQCPQCPVMFNQKSAVNSHVRTVHKGERRFFCPKPGCGQKFGASGDVTRHVDSVHLERRPYTCEDCGTHLSRKTVLYRHVRNVHKKEPKILAPTPR